MRYFFYALQTDAFPFRCHRAAGRFSGRLRHFFHRSVGRLFRGPFQRGNSAASEVTETAALPDGVYTAEFDTDSGMFHANEACDGKGTLTVKDGKMTFHVSLVSKKS